MAQGAAMALEDAMILARCLDGVDVDGLDAAFRRYELIRKPRASAVQQMSGSNTWMQYATDPDWVYGYDASTASLENAGDVPVGTSSPSISAPITISI
jgi:salicylate hydroxylase/6-hydroxynicotinate 3-monooxygenase